jgi:hypothetical protein
VADIAGRLKAVERKLDFIMNNMRMRAAVQSGILGPDGQPQKPKVFEGSLLELYHLSREIPTMKESDMPEGLPEVNDDGIADKQAN